MKVYWLLILITLSIKCAFGQPDSITAVNCFKHIIVNGKITNERYVINQKTFDSKDHLIKEIVYNDSTHQVDRISYFFYLNNLLISKEEYNAYNKLMNIYRYHYNSLNKPIEEIYYEFLEDRMIIKQKVKYSYSDTTLLKKNILNSHNKSVAKTIWEYQPDKIIEITSFTKRAIEKNIAKIETILFYNELKVISKEVIISNTDGSIIKNFIKFQYQSGTNLIEKEFIKDPASDTLSTIINSFNAEKKIFKKIYLDENKNKIACYSIEYNKYFIDPGRKDMIVMPE